MSLSTDCRRCEWYLTDSPASRQYPFSHSSLLKTRQPLSYLAPLSSLSFVMARSLCSLLAVLLLAVLSGVNGSCPTYNTSIVGYNFPGFDLYQVAATSVSDCSAACCATASCQAFTFDTASATQTNCTAGHGCCWLKYQRGDPIASTATNIVSGVVLPAVTGTAAVNDFSVTFTVGANTVGNLTILASQVLSDVSINLASYFGVSASAVLPCLRLAPTQTYQLSGTNEVIVAYMITSPIYSATGITPAQYAIQFQSQVHPINGNSPSFSAPNSNVTALSYTACNIVQQATTFPAPAVLGAPVYDAEITLSYVLNAHPTNMTLWLSQLKADIAANAAFLCNVSNANALVPFITIQSPAPNANPADLTAGAYRDYSLTFTLSASITTATGPYWTPDVLQQGFAYMSSADSGTYDQITLFVPFSASGITIQPIGGLQPIDIPTATGSTGAQGACQSELDITVTLQATFTNRTVGAANTDLFIELIQSDIAWMLAQAADADPGTRGYDFNAATVQAAAIMPYINVVWPYLDAASILSYSPSYHNGTVAVSPFTNSSAYFYIKFNLLAGASCMLDGFPATGVVYDMLEWGLFVDTPVFVTPNAMLQVSVDALHTPITQAAVLSGLPLCPSSVNPPSCSFVALPSTYNITSYTVAMLFTMSLEFPITQMIDMTTKLQTDLAGSFATLSANPPSSLLPYILITSVQSATLSSTLVGILLQGSVSVLGTSAASLAEGFVAQAALGNITLPTVTYWYGAVVPVQTVVTTVVGAIGGVTGVDNGGSGEECAPAYDATVTFLAKFTTSSLVAVNASTFVQLIEQDIVMQLAHAAVNLSASVTVNTTLLEQSVSVVWPYLSATNGQQSIVSYSPSWTGPAIPSNTPQDYFYVSFQLLANATCLFGGLSAVSVADAFFNGMNGTFVSSATQLQFSTSGLQVQPVVLSGLELCTDNSSVECDVLGSSPVSLSSSGSSSSYPIGSETIVFYVVISSIGNELTFAVHIREDIAINLANITGVSYELLLNFVVVTNISVSAVNNGTGARRLLQASHVSVSFVLLGSVSSLSTASTSISASSLSQGFSNKAQQGTLATPTTGASAPAQNVSTTATGPASSSTGYGATNGAHSTMGSSTVFTSLVALTTAVALLL